MTLKVADATTTDDYGNTIRASTGYAWAWCGCGWAAAHPERDEPIPYTDADAAYRQHERDAGLHRSGTELFTEHEIDPSIDPPWRDN